MKWVVLIAAAIAAVDQCTKALVVCFLQPSEHRVVIDGFFNLVNWRNTGAAWGIFQNYNVVLTLISALTVLVLYFFRHSFQLERKASRVALGLIGGGIIGNLVDRVRVHSVIDFLDFHVNGWHWPAFNVADSAICVGVVLYIIVSWQRDGETHVKQPVL